MVRLQTIILIAALLTTLTPATGQDAQALLRKAQETGLLKDAALDYLLEADSLALISNDIPSRTTVQYTIGKYYLLRLNADKAAGYFRRAAKLAAETGDHEQQGFALDRVGLSLMQAEKFDSALLCFQQSMDLYRKHGLDHRVWTPLQGISRIYSHKGDYFSARKYGDEALRSLEGFDEEIARTVVLNHMVALAAEYDKPEDYRRYLDEYLETIDPLEIDNREMHFAAFFNSHESAGERLIKIQEAIDRLSKLTPSLSLLSAYYHLGRAYKDSGNNERAIDAWLTGLSISERVQGSDYRLLYTKGLAEAYANQNDYKQALDYRISYHQLADSLSNAQSARAIDELQLRYETAQKEQTIQAQKFELTRKSQQQSLILIIAGLAVLAGVTIIFALRSRLRYQRLASEQQHRAHEAQIAELEQKNKLLALEAMLKGQEEERKRIAYDLHDGLGGLLSTVKLQFQNFTTGESASPNGDAEKAIAMLDEACSEVRRIAHDMMPHALMKMGLDAAIRDMVNTVSNNSAIDISYQNLTDLERFDESTEIILYRIVQELLQNAIKHADPESIIIQLSRHNGTFTLEVEDDGRGFNQDGPRPSGMGLRSIESRVQILNGTTQMHSNPGGGTTFAIEFPLVVNAPRNDDANKTSVT